MLKRNILILGLSASLLFGMCGCSKDNTTKIDNRTATMQTEETPSNIIDTNEVLSLFENVCNDKPRQELKLDFLEKQLDKIVNITNLLDNNFKDKVIKTSELSENIGPSWEWNLNSTPYAIHELNSTNSFAGIKLKLTTSDDTNEVASAFEGVVILNSNYMKDMVLSDNCYDIINLLHAGESKEFWQDNITKCYEDDETITVESTDKSLTYIYKLGSAVYIYSIENTGY